MNSIGLKRLLLSIIIALTSITSSSAQEWLTDLARIDLDTIYKPFFHGVASGDPLSDAVIIWTRVTPDTQTTGSITVDWKIATDTNMANVVNSGTATTSDTVDYTVKVDVNGLQADTWYYYEFRALNRNSLIGRTKTSPVGDNSHVRFAVVSCSSYEHGYFNAYERIANRNDVEAVLHLGDYIYEYEAGGYSNNITGREYEPTNEIVSLSDYRTRMSLYHLDHDLRLLHQQYPFIMVWDDHETANNSWMNGASNHDSGSEGNWSDRKSAAIQAYFEWLPIRKPDQNDDERIYRKFSYGDLLDLYMLDTRLEGRDEQVGTTSPQLNDSSRSILGAEQYNWLVNKLDSSTAQWQILGQQVMVAPLLVFGQPINMDQWDGYPIERQKFFNEMNAKGVNNLVVLTGDIHTSWGNDLPFHPSINYNSGTGAGSMGVEFIATSITSPGLSLPIPASLVTSNNPHVKYVDLDQRGYLIIDISKTKTQADWYYVPTVTSVDHSDVYGESWYSNDLDGFLKGSSTPTSSSVPAPTKPPLLPHNTTLSATSTDPTTCSDSDGTATATVMGGSTPYTYSWSNGGNSSTINGLTAGTYFVTVTDANGWTANASVILSALGAPTVSATGTDPTTCNTNDGTAAANATGGLAPYSYNWSNGGNTTVINGLTCGTYSVTVTDANLCISSASVILNASGTPTIVTGSNPNEAVLFGVYPNPVEEKLLIKFFLYNQAKVNMKIIDMNGKEVISKYLGLLNKGLFYSDLNTSNLASGTYLLLLQTPSQTLKRKIVKDQ